jgi:nitronate monooxygenase
MWNDTALTRRLDIRYPIVQGPFGGGYSSPALAAAVSNAGGMGSYGAQGMAPEKIGAVVGEIAALTSARFAVNLWVSTHDGDGLAPAEATCEAALAPLRPFFDELGIEPPRPTLKPGPTFEEQASALIEARPPAFSFIFGIPQPAVFDACRTRGIVTIGTATTVDEARAIEQAGADVVVASGFEAGGHRSSFLRSAEASLMGTFALVPLVADAVRIPVVAAGGVADGRGVAAALTLGAAGVQVGTAFLACDESNAPPAHRTALLNAGATPTILTRAYTGRLARGLSNRLGETLHATSGPWLPYPLQGELVRALRDEALRQGRTDLVVMLAGQAAPLVKHQRAADVFNDLVETAGRLLAPHQLRA